MKKIGKSLIIIFLMLICILFSDNKTVGAENDKINLSVPDRIITFAENKKGEIINQMKQEGIIMNNAYVKYATPYIIYTQESKQEAIYYFPLVQDEKIIMMIIILDTEEGLVIQCDEDLIEQLNRMDYLHTQPVFYQFKCKLYAENAKQKICLYSFGNVKKNYSKSERKAELKFFHKTYIEKKEIISKKIKNMKKCVCSVEYGKQNLNEIMKATLILNYPKGQHGYNMCWAAAVATIVNYKKDSGITPFEVCNKMGIKYDTGGTIFDEKNALSKYGIAYNKIRDDMLSWSQIKDNIDSKNPIIANLKCNDGVLMSHAVTIFGYTSAKKIKYWDSNLKNGNGGERTILYSSASSNFLAINNHSYSWMTTLSSK